MRQTVQTEQSTDTMFQFIVNNDYMIIVNNDYYYVWRVCDKVRSESILTAGGCDTYFII